MREMRFAGLWPWGKHTNHRLSSYHTGQGFAGLLPGQYVGGLTFWVRTVDEAVEGGGLSQRNAGGCVRMEAGGKGANGEEYRHHLWWRILFHNEICTAGIEALRLYRFSFCDRLGHRWASWSLSSWNTPACFSWGYAGWTRTAVLFTFLRSPS